MLFGSWVWAGGCVQLEMRKEAASSSEPEMRLIQSDEQLHLEL